MRLLGRVDKKIEHLHELPVQQNGQSEPGSSQPGSSRNGQAEHTKVPPARRRLRPLAAELLYLVFLATAIVSALYDFSVTREHTISAYVNRWVHSDPVLAVLSGCLIMILVYLIHLLW